jgi:hypothetical protein
MPIHHREIYRAIPAGDGINGVQLQAYRRLDNSEINGPVTTATVGVETGTAEFDLSDPATTGKNAYELHPGPYRIEGTHNNVTRRNSSADHSKTGPTDLSALPQLARALGNGIIQSPNGGLNTGEVTADGATRTVTVATYAATVAGIQVENDDARTLVIAANASGSTRVDTIVTEMYKPGDDQEGRCTLKVVAGTLGA